jgi:hypothetical protein
MRIENLRKETHGDRTRVVATVIWENRVRPVQEVFFETTSDYAADLTCNPNAFLAACGIPAMRFGEQRVTIDAPICPVFKEGLENVMDTLSYWYGGDRRVIPIEAPSQTAVSTTARPSRAGCFFSGGIDALCMLRKNHLSYPSDHPRYVRDGILVYGILKGEDEKDPAFQHVLDAISALALDAGINLIPIYTNAHAFIRDLDSRYKFWKYEFHGAFLAAVSHVLSGRLSTVSIASSSDLTDLNPWGTHPLIDPQLSSGEVDIHHEDFTLSRFEKTKIVGEWATALQHLRVCNHKTSYQSGNYNCGRCEKCINTMTALLSLGLLEQTQTFVEKNVSAKQLFKAARIPDADVYDEACYRDLIVPLKQMGRLDLVVGIQGAILYGRLKYGLKQWDRVLFRGTLFKLIHWLQGGTAGQDWREEVASGYSLNPALRHRPIMP